MIPDQWFLAAFVGCCVAALVFLVNLLYIEPDHCPCGCDA